MILGLDSAFWHSVVIRETGLLYIYAYMYIGFIVGMRGFKG